MGKVLLNSDQTSSPTYIRQQDQSLLGRQQKCAIHLLLLATVAAYVFLHHNSIFILVCKPLPDYSSKGCALFY